jgi:hypothetical protein
VISKDEFVFDVSGLEQHMENPALRMLYSFIDLSAEVLAIHFSIIHLWV